MPISRIDPRTALKLLSGLRKIFRNWPVIVLFAVPGVVKGGLGAHVSVAELRNSAGTCRITLSNALSLHELLQEGWTGRLVDSRHLLVKKGQIKITTRIDCGADLGHLLEIFEGRTYGESFRGKLVIDVGMSNGDSSIYFAIGGASTVIGLEPFPESYNLAVRNIAQNGLGDRIQTLRAALSSVDGETRLRLSASNPNANSIKPSAAISSVIDFDSETKVQAISLSSLLKLLGANQIGLLKLDCEGCEYTALKSASVATLQSIEEIRMEFHSGADGLPQLLRRAGFEVKFDTRNKIGYLLAKRQ